MKIIKDGIKELINLNDNDDEPCAYDVDFYIGKSHIFISRGTTKEFPVYLYLYDHDLTEEQEKKIFDMTLLFSRNQKFKTFFKRKIVAELELNEDNIEKIIEHIFLNIFNFESLDNLSYKIYPV